VLLDEEFRGDDPFRPAIEGWSVPTEAATRNPDQTVGEVRDRVEQQWGGLTTERGSVDYLEIELAGLPAL
jgi:hypothetical protein